MSERECKYGCKTILGEFDTKENKYLETDGKTLHTKERCQLLKEKQQKIVDTIKQIEQTNNNNQNNNNNNKKEEQVEIRKIKNNEPIKRTRISTNNKRGYTYEYTINRPMTFEMGHKRLVQLYGGVCSSCGAWPDYKVMHDYGDERGGAWLVYRYCQSCLPKEYIKKEKEKK